jgi:O-antigen/teichoic acid export membrane protein
MSKSVLNIPSVSLDQIRAHIRTPLYANAYALIANNAVTSGLGLLYWALAARYYTTPQVGLNSATISFMIFLSTLAQLNLTGALTRFIPRAGKATLPLVLYAYASSLAVTLLVAGAFLLGLNVWGSDLSFLATDPSLVIWFVLANLTWTIFALQDSVLMGLHQSIWVLVENSIFSIVKIGLLLLFVGWFQTFGIFASWTLSVAATLIPINALIFQYLIPKHIAVSRPNDGEMSWRAVVKFVAGDYLGSLFATMAIRLLPIIVVAQLGASANAYFYLAWTIAYSLHLVATYMATSLTVEGSAEQMNLELYSRRTLINMVRLILPAVLVMLLAAPYLLQTLGSTYAAEGTTLLQLLVLSVIPSSLNAFYMGVARVQRQIKGMIAVQAVLALLVLVLSSVLLPFYGVNGVGVGWLSSQLTVAIALVLTQLRPVLRSLAHESET